MSTGKSAARGGRLDVEWIALDAGIKPANRLLMQPEYVDGLMQRAARRNLTVVRAEKVVEFPGRPPGIILYVAPTEAYALEMARTEGPILPTADVRLPVAEAIPYHRRFGELLGFPACCVEEFLHRLAGGVTRRERGGEGHEDFVAAERASARSKEFWGRLNDLSADRVARLVTFYPCRYDCEHAGRYASGVYEAALRVEPVAAAALRDALVGRGAIAVDGTRWREGVTLAGDVVAIDFARF